MSGRIPAHFIDELIARVDIASIIDAYVPLRKAGHEFKACCPFHDEKTPSFTVSPAKQFYHCFGCGAHGTAIGFLMDYGHLGFVEAVEELAGRAGLVVPREEGGEAPRQDTREAIFAALAAATRHYQSALRQHPEGARAVAYLKDRGLSGETAREYLLGYAPADDGLSRALHASGFRREQLLAAGLLSAGPAGSERDRFRDRVVFPIRDTRARVVGFGARVLGDATPKYLNSPQTDVFHKGRELYGLYEVLRASRKLERVLVVEGYMDVLSLAQHGIRYAVATLGTAVGGIQVERLFRHTDTVVFCFDGDQAGRTAAGRALDASLALLRDGRSVGFMFLPQGEDPDSLIRHEGPEAFEARIQTAHSCLEYLVESRRAQVDLDTLEGKAKLVERIRPSYAALPEGALRELLVARLAALTGLADARLRRLLGAGETAPPAAPAAPRRNPPEGPRGAAASVLRRIALTLLAEPDLAQRVHVPEGLARTPVRGVDVVCRMLEICRATPNVGVGAALLERMRDHPAYERLGALYADIGSTVSEGAERQLQDDLDWLDAQRLNERFEALRRKEREVGLTEQERVELVGLASNPALAGRVRRSAEPRRGL